MFYIHKNKFRDNQDGIALFEEHKLPRATFFQMEGHGMVEIIDNQIQNSGSMFDTVIPDKMPSYSAHLPETYFNYQ